jgi:hypothetical protein
MNYIVCVGDVEVSRYDITDPELDPVWTRHAPTTPGKAGVWAHCSGIEIHHCGHPTANYPYMIVAPGGQAFVASNGRGFRTVKDAKEEVDRIWHALRGEP